MANIHRQTPQETQYQKSMLDDMKQANSFEVHVWYIGNAVYGNLKKLKGFENLSDPLNVTKEDFEVFIEFGRSLGVPDIDEHY